MKRTVKKALCVVLALALMLSLCVTAMAKDEGVHYDNYLCLGDSIPAGNGREGYEGGVTLNEFIPGAYPTMVKEAVGAGEDSFQGARAGWRVREVLTIMGEVERDAYTNEWVKEWCKMGMDETNDTLREKYGSDMGAQYRKAIANADLITIELGSNEILGNVLWRVMGAMYNDAAGTSMEAVVRSAIEKTQEMGVSLKALDYLLSVAKALDTVDTYANLLVEVEKAAGIGVKEFVENWDKLIEYIDSHNTKNADIVVLGLYNPLDHMLEGSGLEIVGDLLAGPYLDAIKYTMQYGSTYANRYTYVDLTDLDMTGTADGFHPGDIGHQTIYERVMDALQNMNRCEHQHTYTLFAKEATPFRVGYTGDVFCKDCGEFLQQGSLITHCGEVELPRGAGYAALDKVLHTTGNLMSRLVTNIKK